MIYARQIAPEWQESPIFLDGMFPENIVVTGNRDYISRTTAEYDRVLDTLESYSEALESPREYGYKCATEAAIDRLQPVKGKFSTVKCSPKVGQKLCGKAILNSVLDRT